MLLRVLRGRVVADFRTFCWQGNANISAILHC